MFSSIKEILAAFKIKKPAEKEIAEALNGFFKEKNISVPRQIKVSYNKGVARAGGDPYVSSYIKINNQEVLSYLKNKLPLYKIEGIM